MSTDYGTTNEQVSPEPRGADTTTKPKPCGPRSSGN